MRNIITLLAMLVPALTVSAQEAQWISPPQKDDGAMPAFRKVIHIRKPVSKAVLSSSALGVYQMWVDGNVIDDKQLKPGWTDYRYEIPMQQMDVTLKKGNVCLAATVSNGWWAGPISRNVYGKDVCKAFYCKLDVHYKDGTRETFVSDTTWRCSTEASPFLLGDIYNGETYDARKSMVWTLAKYDDSSWAQAVKNNDHHGTLIVEEGPAVRIRDLRLWRTPISIIIYEGSTPTSTTFGTINTKYTTDGLHKPVTLSKGQTLLIDFGQNMVGWIDFTAKGKTGTTLTWRFGEMLNYNGDEARLDKGPGGSLWTYNLRTAKATLNYIMNGTKEEEFHPSHTFMGFRYAELTATDDVEVIDVKGQVVGSDLTEWGEFKCSNLDVNQLYSNVWWGQRGNFLYIPTDCPQRDERLGWTGDTQIFSLTALYNSDAKDFYRKWMRDMRNSQREDGAFPETAPFCNMWAYGNAGWGDAGIIVPWNVYMMTGDKDILTENYAAMCRWMDFCAKQTDGEWTHIGADIKTGDWLAYKKIDGRYVAYCYYAYVAQLMTKVARVLGKEDNAARYQELFEGIRTEYQRRYITDGEINTGKDTQTAFLMALHYNMLFDSQKKRAREALRRNIETNGYKLSTGFLGTGILMPTLTENGMTDLAYRLLLQRDNPSWLYSIDQGATTVWERWDSYTKEGGFHKHHWNMNSFNHYAYGCVVEWFYSGILGIQPDESQPGFRHIILHPQFGGDLDYAKGATMTPQGKVSVEWKKQSDGSYIYKVHIPEGSTATLYNNGTQQTLGSGKHTLILFQE